jgi:hypothetical protein
MAIQQITLTFPQPLNTSVQVGDTVYYTNDINGNDIVEIGIITNINQGLNQIVANIDGVTIRPSLASFILFSKTNKANTSALKGYYAEVGMINDSKKKIELFSLASETFESSK